MECNHADKKINKSEKEYEMRDEIRQWTQPLEGDAQNIATYKLISDLGGDPFIVCDHVPQSVGQQKG